MRKLLAVSIFFGIAALAATDWREQGILYLDHSPHAVMHPVPVSAVTLGEGFWSGRRTVNVERSIPTMLELLEEHGIVDNFRRLAGKKSVPRRGPLYTDSDLYKWIEAVGFVLQSGENPKLRGTVEGLIDDIVAAQEPSGYLNTYYQDDRKKLRFTEMTRSHELYCLGHLLQASIAWYRATGERKLLDAGIRYMNYLAANFGPSPDKHPLVTGHPELEMASVELYRTTGDRRYLDMAAYLLSGVETERLHLTPSQTSYMFSGIPFTSRTQFEGHAVRAMYAASGATDYYAETGDPTFRKALDTLWADLTAHKMYVTGGVGSRASGEAFGEDYELPNSQAYGESCAAIGNMMWNFRMLAISGQAKYADVLERALYNGVNSGMSLSGTLYCYRNPLASNGEKIRNEWYDTTCCPPNLQRILASLPGYFYATAPDGVFVHLYHNATMNWHLEDGTPLKIEQATNYPWTGAVAMTVTPARPVEFTLRLRVPGWSKQSTIAVNGGTAQTAPAGEYVAVRRLWKPGDRIELQFDMAPREIVSNPLVPENDGKLALLRGPLVYCLEQLDQKAPLNDVALTAPSAPFQIENRPGLLGGIVALEHDGGKYVKPLESEPLYSDWQARKRATAPVNLFFIPYYAWANREPDAMEVWVPVQ